MLCSLSQGLLQILKKTKNPGIYYSYMLLLPKKGTYNLLVFNQLPITMFMFILFDMDVTNIINTVAVDR